MVTEVDDYYQNKHIFLNNDTLYVLGEFNQDVSNEVIPKMNDLVQRLSMTRDAQFEIIINSPGGYFDELLSILYYIDVLKSMNVKIITKVIGVADSCASMLAVYGDERYMYKYASNLMHFGYYPLPTAKNYTDVNRCADNCKNHFDKIIDIYLNHSKLSEEEIKKLLNDDNLRLSAEKCLEYGFCDYIVY